MCVEGRAEVVLAAGGERRAVLMRMIGMIGMVGMVGMIGKVGMVGMRRWRSSERCTALRRPTPSTVLRRGRAKHASAGIMRAMHA